MSQSQFHPIGGFTASEKKADNTKEFVGDGTPYLKVPGLKKVEAVRVGTQVLEDYEQQIPTDLTLKNFETETVEVVKLVEGPDGEPVLLRNLQSNDGIWQKGVSVFVSGEYAPAAKGKAAKASADGDPAGTGSTGTTGTEGAGS